MCELEENSTAPKMKKLTLPCWDIKTPQQKFQTICSDYIYSFSNNLVTSLWGWSFCVDIILYLFNSFLPKGFPIDK